MGQYTNKGLYNAYDKNHKERNKEDYYATPSEEVLNILETLGLDFENKIILEPCIGGGHMAKGIEEYIYKQGYKDVQLIGTDIRDRGFRSDIWRLTYGLDFFADDYPEDTADWIIMNPPYSVIEPFTIRALDIAGSGVIMLARLQFLEGEKRYEKILENNPPTDVYVYVDRIQCWKDGVEPEGSSAQAYAWIIWDKTKECSDTKVHWIRRVDKRKA